MKKVLMILIGAMLILSMAGFGSGADYHIITGEDYDEDQELGTPTTQDVTVTLVISDSFTVSILPSFELDKNSNGVYVYNDVIRADVTLIQSNGYLNVYLDGKNTANEKWYLAAGENKLEYAVKLGTGPLDHIDDHESDPTVIKSGSCVLTASNGDPEDARYLHFKLLDSVTATGTYTDILTFTVKIEATPGTKLFVNPTP